MTHEEAHLKLKLYEELIRSGRLEELRTSLLSDPTWRPPRELLGDYANIARRCGLHALSLRILQPVVRPEALAMKDCSPAERAIYAAGLAAIGAVSEARNFIAPVANHMSHEVQLFAGFVHIHGWDYKAAAPFFVNYQSIPGATPYQLLVAKLNLASCLSFLNESVELESVSRQIIAESRGSSWHLLTRDAYTLLAQSFIQRSQWREATEQLDEGIRFCKDNSLDDFLLRKWKVFLALHLDGWDRAHKSNLAAFRGEAVSKRRYEASRDCDYYEGLLTSEKSLLQRVYVGTPFESHRLRTLAAAQGAVALSKSHRRSLYEKRGDVLDLERGTYGKISFGRNGLALRVLRTLAADYYRPTKIGGLFAGIYPGEHYDPVHSPGRVRSALTRTRALLSEWQSPLAIDCVAEEYQLSASAPCDLVTSVSYEPIEADYTPQLRLLESRWSYKSFSLSQAAEALKLPPKKTSEILKFAAEHDKVFTSGERRSKLYRFAK